MCPDQNRPHDNRDVNDAVDIPRPRKAPDDNVDNLPKVAPDHLIWRYNQQGKGGGRSRQFTGFATEVGGAEGERLRGDLAAIIRDLLEWAAQQQADAQSGDDDSGNAQHPK